MIRYETADQSQPIPGTYTMTGYVYDAAGNRVAKGTILTMSCDPSVNGYQATNDYVRGPGQVAQSNATKPYPRRNETVPRSSQSYRDERALGVDPVPRLRDRGWKTHCRAGVRMPHSCAFFAHEWGSIHSRITMDPCQVPRSRF